MSTIAALRHRQKTGQGQKVDVSMFQAGIATTGDVLLASGLGVAISPRQGSDDPNAVPHGVYRCRSDEEWAAIAVQTDDQWVSLCDAMGRPELAVDPAFASLDARRDRQEEIDLLVGQWCSSQDGKDVQHDLQRRGIPAGVVLRAAGMLQDEHLVARQSNPFVSDPDMGPQPVPALAWHYSRMEERPTSPAPRFGEHTGEVLRSLTGLEESDIEALYQSNAISDEPVRAHGEG